MKHKLRLSPLLLALLMVSTPSHARANDAEKLVVISCGDTLKFDITKIETAPGQKIHLKFTSAALCHARLPPPAGAPAHHYV